MHSILGELFTSPLSALIYIAFLVIAITVHEFAHAKMADALGDPTPGLQGRLTLNPRAHLDLWGSLFILLTGFGWGRPVQFDPYNLRDPRKDAMKIAIAGPLSNILMALAISIFVKIAGILAPDLIFIEQLGAFFISLNVGLAIFNLIPVEPLDGFKVVGGLLPEEQAQKWYSLSRYGMLFLLLVIIPLGRGPTIAETFVSTIGGFILRFLI